MSYLQLAEDPYSHLADNIMSKYIFIPAGYRGSSKDMYVREDFFDDLPSSTYNAMMQELAPYQNTGLSSKASDRRDARKQKKQDAKQKRIETRQTGKANRAEKWGGALGKITETVGGLIGGKQVDVSAGGGGLEIDYNKDEPTFWDNYKIPIIIGGVALVGGGIYLATRKKKG